LTSGKNSRFLSVNNILISKVSAGEQLTAKFEGIFDQITLGEASAMIELLNL